MIDGVMYWVSGWVKEGSKGPFMSLAFKRRDVDAKPAKARSQDDDMSDSIPF